MRSNKKESESQRAREPMRKGQSMIEVVVGLGIATLLAVALISTTIYTEKLSRSAKNRTQATKLVQQALEQLRGFRDSQVGGFANLPGANGCYYDTNSDPLAWTFNTVPPAPAPCTAAPPVAVPNLTEQITLDTVTYSRWVQFTNISANQKNFTVYVSWQGGSGVEYVSNASSLSNPCTVAASSCP